MDIPKRSWTNHRFRKNRFDFWNLGEAAMDCPSSNMPRLMAIQSGENDDQRWLKFVSIPHFHRKTRIKWLLDETSTATFDMPSPTGAPFSVGVFNPFAGWEGGFLVATSATRELIINPGIMHLSNLVGGLEHFLFSHIVIGNNHPN